MTRGWPVPPISETDRFHELKRAGNMLGKFFKKAKETVSGISDAVRGVEHVDWITHAFPYSLEMLMDVDEARDLSRPRPPAGLDPAAVQYADAWYGIWARVRDGHVAPVQAVEAGDVAGAQQALAQWEAQLAQADVEQARLGDFRGNRHLVLANSDIHTTLGAMVEEVREYIGLRISGQDPMEHATEAITRVVSIHTSMNNALLGFYHDPSGAAARAAENAAFAPIDAMRQVNPAAPELQPVLGVSLHDWVAASAKMHAGVPGDEIARILGVERPQWDQASAEWTQRVQMFPMTVGMEYANLMSRPHPKFDAAGSAGGAPSNAARLSTDRDFYIECAAAAAAATEAGLDAGGYLESNYGVTVAQVGSAGVNWMMDLRNADSLITLQQAKQREIAARIASQTGPGIADDIQF